MPITQKDTEFFFQELLKTYNVSEIAEGIGVRLSTAKRWISGETKIPKQYYVEMKRFAGSPIDWGELSEVDKDQFFTSPENAQYCWEVLQRKLKGNYTFIEPSVGDGSFGRLLPEGSIFLDIDPKFPGTVEGDYLAWYPEEGRDYVVVGNPPFGFRGNLALKFINHSATFAKYVAFILPQTFESDGKGSCKSRVRGLNLIHSEKVSSDFHYPNGKETSVSCVFQIWSKDEKANDEKVNVDHLVKVMSVSDGGTPSTTRNKKYHIGCDYYILSSCYGKENMVLKESFAELTRPGYGFKIYDPAVKGIIESIDWSSVAFVSTNGAVNLRVDLIQKAIWDRLPTHLKKCVGVLPL